MGDQMMALGDWLMIGHGWRRPRLFAVTVVAGAALSGMVYLASDMNPEPDRAATCARFGQSLVFFLQTGQTSSYLTDAQVPIYDSDDPGDQRAVRLLQRYAEDPSPETAAHLATWCSDRGHSITPD